jgi:C-terminal processing protease CtpA/Prc
MKSLMKARSWLFIVLVIHIAILVFGLGAQSQKSGEQGNNPEDLQNVGQHEQEKVTEFIPKNNKKTTTMTVSVVDVRGDKKTTETPPEKQTTKSQNKACGEGFYYGVGVEIALNIIVTVAEGYAADLAGVQVGDLVVAYREHADMVWKSGGGFRGEDGTGIDLKIKRNGKEFVVTMVREKICYEE